MSVKIKIKITLTFDPGFKAEDVKVQYIYTVKSLLYIGILYTIYVYLIYKIIIYEAIGLTEHSGTTVGRK